MLPICLFPMLQRQNPCFRDKGRTQFHFYEVDDSVRLDYETLHASRILQERLCVENDSTYDKISQLSYLAGMDAALGYRGHLKQDLKRASLIVNSNREKMVFT
ncbi:hypothetical protein TNCT_205031 [Trichonephila clavata]|uniref:Uncharacterized protein n=1 Tax=Trichonephila clavata TaxID=2740835 RepID=A0A8X6FU98_TRICU|nr:hypothetical protein TNCT_205031 [Trichonephila clavata]